MYVREDVMFDVVERIIEDENCGWILSITAKTAEEETTISIVYRSPSTSRAKFCTFFEKWLEVGK